MKYAIIIADGASDYPLEELGGKTPLEAARTPNADSIATLGQIGTAQTIPRGFSPGSDIATLCLLGYNPKKYYTGRAPLEASNLGIELGPRDWAFRCNLITARDSILEDFSAGHISTKEAQILIAFLDKKLSDPYIHFYAGNSYRNIMLYKGPVDMKVRCVPPHDIMGKPIAENLPKGRGSKLLIKVMEAARSLLARHELNRERISIGKPPANMIWLWGQGKRPSLPTFREKYGMDSGAVITAVDLIKGLARYLGWDIINVPGATGYLDTDYRAKGRYAAEALKTHTLILVHVEAPDEASHMGDAREKIKAIENIDTHITGPLLEVLKGYGEYRVLLLPDHYTVIQKRTHSDEPVPFALCGTGAGPGSGLTFTEANALSTGLSFKKGDKLMDYFLRSKSAAGL